MHNSKIHFNYLSFDINEFEKKEMSSLWKKSKCSQIHVKELSTRSLSLNLTVHLLTLLIEYAETYLVDKLNNLSKNIDSVRGESFITQKLRNSLGKTLQIVI